MFRLDEDTAIEYDCNTSFLGITDYCVHFMSRNPEINPEKLQKMMEFAGIINNCMQQFF